MPSIVVTAHTTAVTAAAERLDAKHQLKSLTIDNNGGAADQEIEVVDSFTTSLTNGQSATAKTITRWRDTVPMGFSNTYNKDDLDGVQCLGALTIKGDSIDANCHVSVGYD